VGFLVEYLNRVAEVKDTVHKQTLLSHVANIMLDQFPDTNDLYSEIGSVTRCAKVCQRYFIYYTPLLAIGESTDLWGRDGE